MGLSDSWELMHKCRPTLVTEAEPTLGCLYDHITERSLHGQRRLTSSHPTKVIISKAIHATIGRGID